MFINYLCLTQPYFKFAEVVQRKSPRQVKQPGVVWQAHIWEAVQGSTSIQTDHTRSCLWKAEGPRFTCQEGLDRAQGKGYVNNYIFWHNTYFLHNLPLFYKIVCSKRHYKNQMISSSRIKYTLVSLSLADIHIFHDLMLNRKIRNTNNIYFHNTCNG